MRTLTLFSLLAAICAACANESAPDDATPAEPTWLADRPGNAYAYADETLARFRKLVEGGGWRDAAWNEHGTLKAIHEETGLAFVLIPAGSFLMGSPEEEKGRGSEEGPVHSVTMHPFLLCRTECTQSAWGRGGALSEAWFEGADRPEDSLRWTECQDWCSDNRLRLPSESEWEYACRAGTTTPFSTGETLTTDRANYDGSWPYAGAPQGEYREQTVAAGSLPANPWGLHEMHGNVWEWCEDAWHEDYQGAPKDGAAWTMADDWADHIIRGGGWPFPEQSCGSATRVGYPVTERMYCLGVRPAADLPR
jgi:formylglycine-generating enzyme required for sulfatase activity